MNIENGPRILTYSGLEFNLVHPTIDMVSPRDIAHSLSLLCRFGGHCRTFYSVAQHSVYVSEESEKMAPVGREVEYAVAGLLHDAAEAYVGDIISPVKSLIPYAEVLHDRILSVILRRYRVSLPLPETIGVVDKFMLVTEAQALMYGRPLWSHISGCIPLVIEPWTPIQAEIAFIHRMKKLCLLDEPDYNYTPIEDAGEKP